MNSLKKIYKTQIHFLKLFDSTAIKWLQQIALSSEMVILNVLIILDSEQITHGPSRLWTTLWVLSMSIMTYPF